MTTEKPIAKVLPLHRPPDFSSAACPVDCECLGLLLHSPIKMRKNIPVSSDTDHMPQVAVKTEARPVVMMAPTSVVKNDASSKEQADKSETQKDQKPKEEKGASKS